jgi:molybdopterin-containing oxidoreductase family membrane subunit
MQFESRMGEGPYAWAYWSLLLCNGVIPQILWFKKYRTNLTCCSWCRLW